MRWPPSLVEMLTSHSTDRGRFSRDVPLGYTLRRNFTDPSGSFSHNSLGFRGPEISSEKPGGVFRVVILGASTVYGIYVGDRDTSAQRLEETLRNKIPSKRVEVINAGVPGWNSLETLTSFSQRILSLHPDVIIVADGRNDIYPQLFNNYRDDYSHYRRVGYDFTNSNYRYKQMFRVSHLFMLLAARGSGHFGFSFNEENPAYAVINYSNLPTAEDIIRNSADRSRSSGFRRNLQRLVQIAQQSNVRVILSTIPFLEEKYASNVIPREDQTLSTLARQVQNNNEIIRIVARDMKLPLVDAAAKLQRDDLLMDDCHFNKNGEKAYAELMAPAVQELLDQQHDDGN